MDTHQLIIDNIKNNPPTHKEDFIKKGIDLAMLIEKKSREERIMAYESLGNEIENDTHKEWLIEGMSMVIDDDESKKLMIDSVYQIDLYTTNLKEIIDDLKKKEYAGEIKDAISSMETLHEELMKRAKHKIKFK